MARRIGKSLFPALAATLLTLFCLTRPAMGNEGAAPAINPPAAATAPLSPPSGANCELLTREGFRLLAADHLPEALSSFEEALRLQPRAAAPKTGKGMVLARQGDLQGAKRMLQQALLLNPDPAKAHYELGRVYQELGEYPQAIAEFKRGIATLRGSAR